MRWGRNVCPDHAELVYKGQNLDSVYCLSNVCFACMSFSALIWSYNDGPLSY